MGLFYFLLVNKHFYESPSMAANVVIALTSRPPSQDLVKDVIGVAGAGHAVPHLHHGQLRTQAGLTVHLLNRLQHRAHFDPPSPPEQHWGGDADQMALTHLVAELWIIQRVQFVGDVFANQIAEDLIEEGVRFQEVCQPLPGPAQELTVFFCHDGHLPVRKTLQHFNAMLC